jgi:hypothetical protein
VDYGSLGYFLAKCIYRGNSCMRERKRRVTGELERSVEVEGRRGNGSGRHMKGRDSDIFSAGAGGVWLNRSTET